MSLPPSEAAKLDLGRSYADADGIFPNVAMRPAPALAWAAHPTDVTVTLADGTAVSRTISFPHLAFLKLVKDFEFSSILDIGCGEGNELDLLACFAARAVGVSNDPAASYKPDFFGDYFDYEVETPFAAIWCAHTAEHVRNPGAFFEKIYRDLADGGVLAVTVPYHDFNTAPDVMILGHATRFNVPLLIYQLICAGFDCRELAYKVYNGQISAIVRKAPNGIPSLSTAAASPNVNDLWRWFPAIHFEGGTAAAQESELNWGSLSNRIDRGSGAHSRSPDRSFQTASASMRLDPSKGKAEAKEMGRRPEPRRFAPQTAELSDDEAAALVARTSWYNAFQLRPGLTSPGVSAIDPAAALDALGVKRDLTGLKALDIGAWDGPLTFELERRGARAFALDVQDPSRVGFAAARQILRSDAVHYMGSVYDLPFDELEGLDVVIFRGVYYHLKHPILAFERISKAMKLGARLYFEGEGFINYAEDLDGVAISSSTVSDWAESNVPMTLCYPNSYKSSSNWFVPNAACLRSWMMATGFAVKEMSKYTSDGAQRLYGWAEKISEADVLEHPLY